MAKEELKLQLMKWYNKMSAKFGFNMEDASEFSELMKQLDEPKKVVIPEFIANNIKHHKKHGSTLRGTLGSTFAKGAESDVCCWFFADDGDENVRKYISAWDNGYEVEKEPKYYVKVRGFDDYYTSLYVNYTISVDTFSLADTSETKNDKTAFTKSWLAKNWPEYDAYNNAGLLEFEEVEDE